MQWDVMENPFACQSNRLAAPKNHPPSNGGVHRPKEPLPGHPERIRLERAGSNLVVVTPGNIFH